jgi:hypothetical protein
VPRKWKEQSKHTPASGKRSSAPDAIRLDYANRIGEIGNDVTWFSERRNNLPASALGPRLHRRIVRARNSVRTLIGEFVAEISLMAPNYCYAKEEAKKAWPLFYEKVAHFIAKGEIEGWGTVALAEVRGKSRKHRRYRAMDARKLHISLIKRKYPNDAGNNKELYEDLDSEEVSVLPDWGRKSWSEAWADKTIRSKVSMAN